MTMTYNFNSALIVLLAIAIAYAPGGPMEAFFPTEKYYPSSKLTSSSFAHDFFVVDKGVVTFLGGDGTTQLKGRIHPAKRQPEDETGTAAPVIIMAHGLGLSADCGLEVFIESFQNSGYAVFTFDYATFGASAGFPRHQVSPNRHISDLKAALSMVHHRAEHLGVDASRIVLWGTSLGGGHVLSVAAAADRPVKAVVALVPALGSATESLLGTFMDSPVPTLVGLLKVVVALVRCGIDLITTGHPWYVPLVGKPGSAGMMQNPGDAEGYLSLTPDKGGAYGWQNAASAESVLPLLMYRPLSRGLDKIQIPCLLLAAEKDTLCPAKHAITASQRISTAELVMLQGLGHFDVYHGEGLKQVVVSTSSFLRKYLKG